MLKKIAIFLGIAVLVVMFDTYFATALEQFLKFHTMLKNFLNGVFSGGSLGHFLKIFFALVLIPFFTAGVPTGVYWVAKKGAFAYFWEVLWIAFLVLATALTFNNTL